MEFVNRTLNLLDNNVKGNSGYKIFLFFAIEMEIGMAWPGILSNLVIFSAHRKI